MGLFTDKQEKTTESPTIMEKMMVEMEDISKRVYSRKWVSCSDEQQANIISIQANLYKRIRLESQYDLDDNLLNEI